MLKPGIETVRMGSAAADIFMPAHNASLPPAEAVTRRASRVALSHDEAIAAALNKLDNAINDEQPCYLGLSLGGAFHNDSDRRYLREHLGVSEDDQECVVAPTDQIRLVSKDIGSIIMEFLHPDDTRNDFLPSSKPHFFYRRSGKTGISLLRTSSGEIEAINLFPKV